jgi:hypothetical protein
MKTLIISIIVVLTFMQCKTKNTEKNEQSLVIEKIQDDTCCHRNSDKQEQSLSSNQITNYNLIGEKLDSEKADEINNNVTLNFIIIEQLSYDIDKDGFKENILLEKLQIEKYEEPGDFHRIRIEFKDTCFSFYNSSGWVKIENSANDYINDFTSINKINSEYIVLSKNNDNLLLFAFGYVYASNPGLLSIINLSMKEPQLILNDNFLLVKYEEDNPIFITTRYFGEDEVYQRDTLMFNKNGYINLLTQ